MAQTIASAQLTTFFPTSPASVSLTAARQSVAARAVNSVTAPGSPSSQLMTGGARLSTTPTSSVVASNRSVATLALPGITLAAAPMRFEANVGQARGSVDYLARGQGYGVHLNSSGVLLALRKPADAGSPATAGMVTVLGMQLLGSNTAYLIAGQGGLSGLGNPSALPPPKP